MKYITIIFALTVLSSTVMAQQNITYSAAEDNQSFVNCVRRATISKAQEAVSLARDNNPAQSLVGDTLHIQRDQLVVIDCESSYSKCSTRLPNGYYHSSFLRDCVVSSHWDGANSGYVVAYLGEKADYHQIENRTLLVTFQSPKEARTITLVFE